MQLFRSLTEVPRGFGPSVVAVGKFDGIHLGHRAMIRRLCELAAERALVPTVVTFDRHPLTALRPEAAPPPLVTPAQKAELLAGAGVDAVLMVEFTTAFAALAPEEFVQRYLVDALRARVVLAGADFRFGAKGAGDVRLLRELGAAAGFEVEIVGDLLLDDEGVQRRVSSSWLRELLAAGRVRDAGRLLGEPYRVRSRVVHGEQRGRELGYPTANLAAPVEGMLPLDGVYAAWAHVPAGRFGAMVSIGNNPTFDGVPDHQVEAHLFDQHLDLYGDPIEIAFVDYIRPMNRFDGVESLVAQLRADEVRIRRILGVG